MQTFAAGPTFRPIVSLGAAAAVLAHLAVLYWPVVAVQAPVEWTDKVVHLAIFAVPTYVVGLALRLVAPVVLVFAAHAPVSEWIQHVLLPSRSGDVWDAVLDLVGVAVGAAMLVVGRRSSRW